MERYASVAPDFLYIRRPVLSAELFMAAQKSIRQVLGNTPVFQPRPAHHAAAALLRQSEVILASRRSPAIQQCPPEKILKKVLDSLPASYSEELFVEPEEILIARGVRRHLCVSVHSEKLEAERQAVIQAMAGLGDTATPWAHSTGHISFGSFTRPVTPKTLERLKDEVASSLPDFYKLDRVVPAPAELLSMSA